MEIPGKENHPPDEFKEIFPGKHPALVTKQEYDQVQTIRKTLGNPLIVIVRIKPGSTCCRAYCIVDIVVGQCVAQAVTTKSIITVMQRTLKDLGIVLRIL